MSTQVGFPAIEYPESDGLPLGENMLQFLWITKLVGGLESLFRHDPNVLVAGDLFWYPTEGDNNTCTAPDAMVVFGRPKGLRASYKQWLEEGIAPQVVFEVLSPGNSTAAMRQKQQYYERFGVEEYYVVDPETPYLEGWLGSEGQMVPIAEMDGWVSPRLGIRFRKVDDDFEVFYPDNRPFETYVRVVERAEEERQRAEEERQRAEEERQRAEEERQRAEEERQRADRLAAQLRALGIEPETK